ncbi:AAA family ATPase [Actinomadura sp. DSM 109109]|nr:AAA family ATPase [Actinomadura lepetitiana]
MSEQLVIEGLTVRTERTSQTYQFSAGVTAITGPMGSGKSSMLELIKYGLGGRAQVMPAIRDNVTLVQLKVRTGTHHLELTRSLGGRLVDVVDATSGERIGTWATTNRRNFPRASQELLAAVGLPRELRVPKRRTRPTGDTVPISFFDVYRYLYLSQNGIDSDVVGHSDPNLNIKRLAVFELLYGLSDPKVLELSAQRAGYLQKAEQASIAARNIRQFLEENAEAAPASLAELRQEAEQQKVLAQRRLAELRSASSQTYRTSEEVQRVTKLRELLANVEDEKQALLRDTEKSKEILAQLELEEVALQKDAVASRSLSGLEFTRCPRCLQSIDDREVPEDTCVLCYQHQPPVDSSNSAEIARIKDQRSETQTLLDEDLRGLERAREQADAIREQLALVLTELEARSETPAHPILDEVADAAATLAKVESRISEIVGAQARWSSHQSLCDAAEEATTIAAEIAQKEKDLRLELEENQSIITELSEIFNETLASMRDPWYREAHIDAGTYLPVVDGEPFDLLSVGGGRKTLVNVAFHLANLSMALSHPAQVMMPRFLIIDSPRKNVGEGKLDRSVAEAIYRRMRTLQDNYASSFQIIIADNEVPRGTESWISHHVRLDHGHPLVPGVGHPGESVETLGSASTVEIG